MTEQPALLPEEPFDPSQMLPEGLSDVPMSRWPKELVRGLEVIEGVFKLGGMADEEAFHFAAAAMLALADYNGGRDWYLPRGDALKTALRDAKIYRMAHANNIFTLADEHGITPRHIWRIIHQQRALHIRKIQLPLFPDAASPSI